MNLSGPETKTEIARRSPYAWSKTFPYKITSGGFVCYSDYGCIFNVEIYNVLQLRDLTENDPWLEWAFKVLYFFWF